MSPFEAKGDKARWRLVYERLAELNVGDLISYVELGNILSLDPDRERQPIQMAVRRAGAEFLDKHQRALRVRTNEGYEVVSSAEHMALARGHNSKAGKSLRRGYDVVTKVRASELEPDAQRLFEAMAFCLLRQAEINASMDRRQNRMAVALASLSHETAQTGQETATALQALNERLARLENKLA